MLVLSDDPIKLKYEELGMSPDETQSPEDHLIEMLDLKKESKGD